MQYYFCSKLKALLAILFTKNPLSVRSRLKTGFFFNKIAPNKQISRTFLLFWTGWMTEIWAGIWRFVIHII